VLFKLLGFAKSLVSQIFKQDVKQKSGTKQELEIEKENLESHQKNLEDEYLKRRINEKEFKERFLKTKTKLATIKDLLKKK
tara:strand:- start:10148 stop:10390 length:243 start_codon:yes stop_codon:yes gene_type:complete